MIQYRRKNRTDQRSNQRLTEKPYYIINIVFAGVIVLMLIYSGIFSPEKNNYPVICIHERLTGEPCFSCGLSHSFSLIVRGRIDEAYEWNKYGMRVFLFFFAQLLFRVDFLRLSLKRPETIKQLIIYDSVASGIIFLISFWPFLSSIIKGFLKIL